MSNIHEESFFMASFEHPEVHKSSEISYDKKNGYFKVDNKLYTISILVDGKETDSAINRETLTHIKAFLKAENFAFVELDGIAVGPADHSKLHKAKIYVESKNQAFLQSIASNLTKQTSDPPKQPTPQSSRRWGKLQFTNEKKYSSEIKGHFWKKNKSSSDIAETVNVTDQRLDFQSKSKETKKQIHGQIAAPQKRVELVFKSLETLASSPITQDDFIKARKQLSDFGHHFELLLVSNKKYDAKKVVQSSLYHIQEGYKLALQLPNLDISEREEYYKSVQKIAHLIENNPNLQKTLKSDKELREQFISLINLVDNAFLSIILSKSDYELYRKLNDNESNLEIKQILDKSQPLNPLLIPQFIKAFKKLPMPQSLQQLNIDNMDTFAFESVKNYIENSLKKASSSELEKINSQWNLLKINKGEIRSIFNLVQTDKSQRFFDKLISKIFPSRYFEAIPSQQSVDLQISLPDRKKELASGSVKTAHLLKSKKSEIAVIRQLRRQYIKLNATPKNKIAKNPSRMSSDSMAKTITILKNTLSQEYLYKRSKSPLILEKICVAISQKKANLQLWYNQLDPDEKKAVYRYLVTFAYSKGISFHNGKLEENQVGLFCNHYQDLLRRDRDPILATLNQHLQSSQNLQDWYKGLSNERKNSIREYLGLFAKEKEITIPPLTEQTMDQVITRLKDELSKEYTGNDPNLEAIHEKFRKKENIAEWIQKLSPLEKSKLSSFLFNFANQKEIVELTADSEQEMQNEMKKLEMVRTQIKSKLSIIHRENFDSQLKYVALSGTIIDPRNDKAKLISNYWNLGSADNAKKMLSPHQRLKGFLCIAKGLEVLHTSNIAHGDIADRNFLVRVKVNNETAEPEIIFALSDWGRAEIVNSVEKKSSSNLVPIIWTAPENISSASVSHSGDSYSMGVAMLELILDDPMKVFNDLKNPADLINKNKESGNAYAQLKWREYYQTHLKDRLTPQLYQMIDRCMDPNPSKRPKASEIRKIVESVDHQHSEPWT